MSELYEYANPSDGVSPVDYEETMATYNYLKALNNLFENGMLSKNQLHHSNESTLINIREGLEYFRNWLKNLKGISFQNTRSSFRIIYLF